VRYPKYYFSIILTVLLIEILFSFIPFKVSSDVYYYSAKGQIFTLPTYTTTIGFNTDRIFTSIYRMNNYWYFNGYGFQVQNANMTINTFFDNEQLSFTLTGETGNTSTTNIYTHGTGRPTNVYGSTSWSYNSATDILTITVLHSSTQEITVLWTSTSVSVPNNTLYYGSFNLYLMQNGSVGSQLSNYYVAIQHLNTTAINTTAFINGRCVNEIYTSRFSFRANTNGKMRILTNLNQSVNHVAKVTVNEEETFVANGTLIPFLNNDDIIIYFELGVSTITKAEIYAIIGIIGVGLFCANPVLSYTLSDKAKDKFKFFFILMGIGIISIGLIFSFIYG